MVSRRRELCEKRKVAQRPPNKGRVTTALHLRTKDINRRTYAPAWHGTTIAVFLTNFYIRRGGSLQALTFYPWIAHVGIDRCPCLTVF